MEWKEILAWSVIGALVLFILGLFIRDFGFLCFLKGVGVIIGIGLVIWAIVYLINKYDNDDDDCWDCGSY